jgi:hypothetical protein
MQNLLNHAVSRISLHPFALIANNTKAQMTTRKYNEWLVNLNRNAKAECEVLLLVDNTSCHNLVNLSNVQLEYLSVNCTGILQPLNAGIIRSSKANY